jgi:hypothetical protein
MMRSARLHPAVTTRRRAIMIRLVPHRHSPAIVQLQMPGRYVEITTRASPTSAGLSAAGLLQAGFRLPVIAVVSHEALQMLAWEYDRERRLAMHALSIRVEAVALHK